MKKEQKKRWKIETIIGTRIVRSGYCRREQSGDLVCFERVPVEDCGIIKGLFEHVPVVAFSRNAWVSVEEVKDDE